MVYIAPPKSNIEDVHLKKFWKVGGKQKQNNEKIQFQVQTQTDTSINTMEEVLVEPQEIPETFVYGTNYPSTRKNLKTRKNQKNF